MKVQLFRDQTGKVVAAAEVSSEGAGTTVHFEPAESQTRGAHSAATQKAPEIVEADISDPEAFFRQHQG